MHANWYLYAPVKIYSCKTAYVYTGISLFSDPTGKMTKGGNIISVSYTL